MMRQFNVSLGISVCGATLFWVYGWFPHDREYSAEVDRAYAKERGDGAVDIENPLDRPLLAAAGRLLDVGGRIWIVTKSVLIPPQALMMVEVMDASVAAGAMTGRHQRELRRFLARERPSPYQVGLVVAIAGQIRNASIFDAPQTFAEHFESYVTVAAMWAAGRPSDRTTAEEALSFVRRGALLPRQRVGSAGLGVALQSADDAVALSGLYWHGQDLHLRMTRPVDEATPIDQAAVN